MITLDNIFWKGKRCHQNMSDMWNYQELLWEIRPYIIVEIGPGEYGTFNFLRDLGLGRVISVGEGQKPPAVSNAFIIIDSDVYNKDSVLKDLATYSPMAEYLVVCHTAESGWGSGVAVKEWLPKQKKFMEFDVPHPTRHTWLKRI